MAAAEARLPRVAKRGGPTGDGGMPRGARARARRRPRARPRSTSRGAAHAERASSARAERGDDGWRRRNERRRGRDGERRADPHVRLQRRDGRASAGARRAARPPRCCAPAELDGRRGDSDRAMRCARQRGHLGLHSGGSASPSAVGGMPASARAPRGRGGTYSPSGRPAASASRRWHTRRGPRRPLDARACCTALDSSLIRDLPRHPRRVATRWRASVIARLAAAPGTSLIARIVRPPSAASRAAHERSDLAHGPWGAAARATSPRAPTRRVAARARRSAMASRPRRGARSPVPPSDVGAVCSGVRIVRRERHVAAAIDDQQHVRPSAAPRRRRERAAAGGGPGRPRLAARSSRGAAARVVSEPCVAERRGATSASAARGRAAAHARRSSRAAAHAARRAHQAERRPRG